MQSLIQKHSLKIGLVLGAVAMIAGFQNCSNGYNFDATSNQTVTKIDNVVASGGDTIPNTDGGSAGTPPVTTPPASGAPSPTPAPVVVVPTPTPPYTGGDGDTRIDYGHDGTLVSFECTTGAETKFVDSDLLNAQDLKFYNGLGGPFEYKNALRYVDIRNIRGDVLVSNAYQADRVEGVSGRSTVVRAKNIVDMLNLQTDVSTASAVRIDGLYNIQGRNICASANEIGTASGLRASAIKFRGRSVVAGVNAKAKTIGNVFGAFISLESLDVAKIEDIHGELIIRNASIDTIAGIEGGLTLINVKVKQLNNASGTLRLYNSTIGSQADMRMKVVNLPAGTK